MLNKVEKKLLIAFIFLFSFFFTTSSVFAAPAAVDYTSIPVATATGDTPNIAVFLDNSPSMKTPIQNMPRYTDDAGGAISTTPTDYSAQNPLDYGGGYWTSIAMNPPSSIALADVTAANVFKLIYDGDNLPAFLLVCTTIATGCYIDYDDDAGTADEQISPLPGPDPGHALYTTLVNTGSDGVYYLGNYLQYQPPTRFQIALQVMLGEDNVGTGTDLDHDGVIDPDTDASNSKGRILGQFANEARWLNFSFKVTGHNLGMQTTTSWSSTYSSNVSTMKSWEVDDDVDCQLAYALNSIGQEYDATPNSGTAWREGSTYYPCRKSFAIFISDGSNNNVNGDSDLATDTDGDMITDIGGAPGDLDADAREPGEASATDEPDYLDDVAKYYYDTDLHAIAQLPDTQNMIVYTIGFGVGTRSDDVTVANYDAFDAAGGDYDKLLRDTATNANGKYYKATDPSTLVANMQAAINEILQQAGSGTAVSVLATSGRGEGAAYQAVFLPLKQDAVSGNNIAWMGFLQSYWVDSLGNLRQDDGVGNEGELDTDDTDGTPEDNIIQFIYNSTDGTVVKVGGSACTSIATGCISFEDTDPIWEAGETLAQRDMAASPRNIYTFLDFNEDGVCDAADCSVGSYATATDSITSAADEFGTFTTSNRSVLRPYLRAADTTEAGRIITYIRGEDDYAAFSYRNRTIDVNGTNKIWSFGDIVNSSPVAITAPTERYDKLYGNSEYSSFYDFNKNRETVVYIGANDGMLHAFTGGKFDATNLDFDYLAADVPNGSNKVPGTELWAYIPYDILPHLKWLTEPTYNHIFYVDLKPKITDAQIFDCDATDAVLAAALVADSTIADNANSYRRVGENDRTGYCWGTILIGGLRFGGGQIDVNGDFDYNAGTADTEKTFKSSFFALDVTDPSKPPKLLWRFTDPNLGFTTSRPTVVKVGDSWFAVFGSGPDNSYDYDFAAGAAANDSGIPDHGAEYVVTGKTYSGAGAIDTGARVFVVDLRTGTLVKTFDSTDGLTNTKAFTGEPIVVDIDFKKAETYPQYDDGDPATTPDPSIGSWNDEVVYFGETLIDSGAGVNDYPWDGKMWRLVLTDNATDNYDSADPTLWALTQVYDPLQPITAPPSSSMDKLGNPWLYFGTGRMYSLTDKENDPDGDQAFYGMKDICWSVNYSKMLRANCTDSDGTVRNTAIDSTNVYPSTTVEVHSTGVVDNAGAITTFTGLESEIQDNYDGWKMGLTGDGERSITKPGIVGGLVFVTTVAIEGSDTCGLAGEGSLYSLYFGTGTAFSSTTIGEGADATHTAADGYDADTVWKKTSLGTGSPAGVAVHIGEQQASNNSGTGGTVFIQDSTGKITQVAMTTAFGLENKIVNWQEVTN